MMDDIKIITLTKPLTLGTETYSEMTLREPTANEWSIFGKLEGVDADIKAVSLVSGIPEAVVRQMGARNLREAAAFIVSFLS